MPEKDSLVTAIIEVLEELEALAKRIATDFMSTRGTGQRTRDNWSDITLRVTCTPRLSVQWRKRIWHANTRGKGRRYYLRYLSERALLRNVREHEYDEIVRTRNELRAILEMYRGLHRLARGLGKVGLMVDESDRQVGFVPERQRPDHDMGA